MRFMVSRRWALFALTVVLLAWGCWWLGRWQFHRLHEREATNIQTIANLKARPDPVGTVLAVGRPSDPRNEWRRVSATGTYDDADSVVIRYQTRDGGSGVDIVTPLRTAAGPAVLVDRGWFHTDNVGTAKVHAPAPPSGTVTVQGWVRADATGGATTVVDRSARAISSRQIAKTVDYPLYGGFIDAVHETPAPAKALVPVERPDLGDGPHFFYGLQWWFFGLLAVFGFGYLAYDERRKLHAAPGPSGRKPPRGPSPGGGRSPDGAAPALASQRPEHAPVDGQHHAGDEARTG